MRGMFEEYGSTVVMIILGSGVMSALLYLLNFVMSGALWKAWGLM